MTGVSVMWMVIGASLAISVFVVGMVAGVVCERLSVAGRTLRKDTVVSA